MEFRRLKPCECDRCASDDGYMFNHLYVVTSCSLIAQHNPSVLPQASLLFSLFFLHGSVSLLLFFFWNHSYWLPYRNQTPWYMWNENMPRIGNDMAWLGTTGFAFANNSLIRLLFFFVMLWSSNTFFCFKWNMYSHIMVSWMQQQTLFSAVLL